ncbi:MAG TPA: pectin acetylesterase-family hydrolase [Polyangiales bacterium]
MCSLLAGGAGCASGAGGDFEFDDAAAQRPDAGDESDADVEPEDAGDPADTGDDADAGQPEAGMDAGDDATLDARAPDASEADSTTPEASTPDSSVQPDTGAPDSAAPDAGRPTSKPLPTGQKYGEWTWVEVSGALCRDGSPAGYYHRRGDDNLMVFLNGSGACMDKFFCDLIPRNVNQSMYQETLLDTSLNLIRGPDPVRQTPPAEGIFKRDQRNPIANWSMIFVPYCTGDVHAGQNPNGVVPNAGAQKFVGYTNLGLFLDSFGPSFVDTQRVLLAGSGAGGFGVLLNFDRVQRFFDAQGAKVSAITDSGLPFQDAYLEACLQKRWRDLWNLNASLPADCTGCRNADGGGLATGLGTYMFKEKYASRMLGGVITSNQDEVVKVFFSAGLDGCTVDTGLEAIAQTAGLGRYPGDRFPKGVNDVITNVAGADNVAYYVINGSRHMHLMRPRYYEQNNLGQSIADWVADVIAGKPTHRGTL